MKKNTETVKLKGKGERNCSFSWFWDDDRHFDKSHRGPSDSHTHQLVTYFLVFSHTWFLFYRCKNKLNEPQSEASFTSYCQTCWEAAPSAPSHLYMIAVFPIRALKWACCWETSDRSFYWVTSQLEPRADCRSFSVSILRCYMWDFVVTIPLWDE